MPRGTVFKRGACTELQTVHGWGINSDAASRCIEGGHCSSLVMVAQRQCTPNRRRIWRDRWCLAVDRWLMIKQCFQAVCKLQMNGYRLTIAAVIVSPTAVAGASVGGRESLGFCVFFRGVVGTAQLSWATSGKEKCNRPSCPGHRFH
jgi:hypothetical protein